MNHPDYRAWKKRALGALLQGQLFQGVDLIEPHWPDYPGPESDRYGCFCSCCERVFRQMFPDESHLPDILDPNGPYGPSGNPSLWEKWRQFRVATVSDFLEDLVHGPGGIREAASETKISLWTRARTGPDDSERFRQDNGVPPTDTYRVPVPWPDWMRHNLPPDYPTPCAPFFDKARSAAPESFRHAVADIVSEMPERYDGAWIRTDASTCAVLGVSSTTRYGYCIGDDLYHVPPVIVCAVPSGTGIDLHFSKLLAPDTAQKIERFQIDTGHIVSLHLEGNRVHLALANLPKGALVTLTASQINGETDIRRAHTSSSATLITQSIEVQL